MPSEKPLTGENSIVFSSQLSKFGGNQNLAKKERILYFHSSETQFQMNTNVDVSTEYANMQQFLISCLYSLFLLPPTYKMYCCYKELCRH